MRISVWEIGFRSLQDAIEITTPGGRFFFHMMATLAEMERDPPKLTPKQIRHAKHLLKDPEVSVSKVAASLGVSRSTFYRVLA